MSHTEAANFFILDRRQGQTAADGWRVGELTGLELTDAGLRLARQPAPPVPLKDEAGTFGGLENPTGVAVAPDGVIYVSDGKHQRIFRVVRRTGLPPRALFFRIAGGPFGGDRFVYLPTSNRVERWPKSLRRDPLDVTEVDVICETVWNEQQARRTILAYANGAETQGAAGCCTACGQKEYGGCGCRKKQSDSGRLKQGGCGCRNKQAGGARYECGCGAAGQAEGAAIDKEWAGVYPAHLPGGESCRTSINYLPCLGGEGRAPRRFREPRGLAVTPSGELYVADSRNHRIQVFAPGSLALKAVWGRRAGPGDVVPPPSDGDCTTPDEQTVGVGQPVAGTLPGQFNEPWDVAADARGDLFIADRGNHRVQKFERRRRRFRTFDGTTLAALAFQVLYGADAGERFVYVPARRRLERWPAALGHEPNDINEAEIISEEVASVRQARQAVLQEIKAKGARDILLERWRDYPTGLAAYPQPETPFQSPAHLAVDRRGRLFVVDADADDVKVLDRQGRVLGRVRYAEDVPHDFKPTAVTVDAEGKLVIAGTGGAHRFDVEDGQTFYADFYSAWRGRCAGLASTTEGEIFGVGPKGGLAALQPPTAYVAEGTYLSRALDSDVENCQWHKLVLPEPSKIPAGTSVTVKTYTAPVELTLGEVQALDPEAWLTNQTNATDFLVQSAPGRFLWLKIEVRGGGVETPILAGLRAYFPRQSYLQYLPAVYQADAVSRDFLDRFLSIFEHILGGLDERAGNLWQLFDVDGVPREFLSWLGGWIDMSFDPAWSDETRRRLLRHAPELYRKRGTPEGLRLLLRLALGIEVQILEHFRLRRWVFLTTRSPLCAGAQLWDNCIVRRLQLDEFARIGEAALDGTPDPLRDPFFVQAHKFSVYVRAGLVRAELLERMLRYLVEQEKPGHTQFDVVKVEPRFRVGRQSTIGIDTHLGAYPRTVLNRCSTLGYDTLLGCGPAPGASRTAVQVGARAPGGVNTPVG